MASSRIAGGRGWRTAGAVSVALAWLGACDQQFMATEAVPITAQFVGVPADATVTVTDTFRLSVNLLSDGVPVTGPTVAWASSAPNVISVSEDTNSVSHVLEEQVHGGAWAEGQFPVLGFG